MATLNSQVNSQSAEFKAKAEAMQALVADLQWQVSKVNSGGGEKYQAKHLARGKLLPRQRIEHLLDFASPFLELSQLAAHGMYGMDIPSAGIICGVGLVQGRHCMIIANDATVKGGTYFPMTVKKAFACPRNCPAKQLALYLLGRFRWCQPTSARRSIPRQAALWPYLLQPSQYVGHGYSTDCRGNGFLYRRWCLCTCHGGRKYYR